MFRTYIGFRGSGKSAYASKIARKHLKKGHIVFSNFPIDGCFLYDPEDIGFYNISNCVLILDEAGIDLSNRNVFNKKDVTTSKQARQWWKLSRHYQVDDIYVFSQAFDFDITLRRLTDQMYIIKNSIFPHFSKIKPLVQTWATDDQGQPTIKFKILPLFFIPFFRKPYYKYYNSFAAPPLPDKHFYLVGDHPRYKFRS